jgi:hypothetical protein
MSSDDIASQLRRQLRWLTYATLVLYLAMALLAGLAWRDSIAKSRALQKETVTTTTALCILRDDMEARVNATLTFLAKHPTGAFGLTAAEIAASVAGDQHTVTALASLNCPPTKG